MMLFAGKVQKNFGKAAAKSPAPPPESLFRLYLYILHHTPRAHHVVINRGVVVCLHKYIQWDSRTWPSSRDRPPGSLFLAKEEPVIAFSFTKLVIFYGFSTLNLVYFNKILYLCSSKSLPQETIINYYSWTMKQRTGCPSQKAKTCQKTLTLQKPPLPQKRILTTSL